MTKPHDNWATYYDFVYQNTFGQLYNGLTVETLKVIKGILPIGKIIDFGAGTGRLAIPLEQSGYNVVAIERSKPMSDIIRQKALELNLKTTIHNCSITEFKNGNSDMALCLFTVLSYATTEQEMKEIINSIYNNLKPNGFFFFDLPNSVFFNTERLIDIHTNDFIREVRLISEDSNNVYTYSESCSGTMNGVAFSYSDKFSIRYLEYKFVHELLQAQGFILVNVDFPQFYNTGSTYKLYKKNENI